MCSFTEQTFVDPGLWAGRRAWRWGYSFEEGVSLARELQCLRRQVISRCSCYSPQVRDAERGTGPARGVEGESWEGFTGARDIGLGSCRVNGKDLDCGKVLTFRGRRDSWHFVSHEGWPRAFLSFQVFLCHSGINTGVLPPWGLVWRLMETERGCSELRRCPWLKRRLTSEPWACQRCTPVERFPQTRTQILALPPKVGLLWRRLVSLTNRVG